MPNRSDLCFATTNRQAALRDDRRRADAVVVIGSANSSNTVALTKVAEAAGCAAGAARQRAFELPDDLTGTVAVTAGASAPESLVNEVLEALAPTTASTCASVTVEDEYFPPPPELREMLKTLSAMLDLTLATPEVSSFDGQADREFTAAQVLSAPSLGPGRNGPKAIRLK
jgi:4-hydroxy-3-methylbut-2-en-1-yl diphosphate reductase